MEELEWFHRVTNVLSHLWQVKCGCFYSASPSTPGGLRAQFLWLCSTDGVNSHLVILSLHQITLRSVGAFDLPESRIAAMEAVPPAPDPDCVPPQPPVPGAADTVWITTESKRWGSRHISPFLVVTFTSVFLCARATPKDLYKNDVLPYKRMMG